MQKKSFQNEGDFYPFHTAASWLCSTHYLTAHAPKLSSGGKTLPHFSIAIVKFVKIK